jgi:hypothetical protein
VPRGDAFVENLGRGTCPRSQGDPLDRQHSDSATGSATTGASLVTLDDATILALIEGIVRGLWPAAQAAQIIGDLAANGPTRQAKGFALCGSRT